MNGLFMLWFSFLGLDTAPESGGLIVLAGASREQPALPTGA